ncbi:MAG: LamG-like jellyroll fold domain-containing protein, partial [Candidatus Nealsonbacteria bacterium]
INIYSNELLELDKWYFVVATYDHDKSTNTGYAAIYINGNKDIGQSSVTPNGWVEGGLDNGDAMIQVASFVPLNSTLDNVRVYKEALSSAQIKQLYVQGAEKHELTISD